ncbi:MULTISPECIES: hypothetical protein [unclassified Clostridium]|uniref:hypothetical protein n=1 Tax=unclassified Clostridium TaxID=2614128 RepID=UPI000297ED69|nr:MULTISPECIES: hypothetical protein [unclassified Clostridium]EKQ54026.1 MAG: hypothetical protein A370_03365 [Clostridium sp. Maddingley MBC34-26]
MSFVRKFGTLLQKTNQDIVNIDIDDDIYIKTFNSNLQLISSKKILPGAYTFPDIWFDINKNDSIYGVANVNKNSIIHFYINHKVIIKNTILEYDSSAFSIQFLYTKNIENNTHIIYYLIDKSNINQCSLIHYYREDNGWKRSEIDSLQYDILTNFVVHFEDSVPIIFYFKITNGYEELYSSTYNLDTNTWSIPIQITNSHKVKVYLSAIKGSDGSYHITYSENNFNRYYCSYINVYVNNYSSELSANKTISETIACSFPNIIEHKKILYIQWVEFNTLHYCISYDFGKTWTRPILDKNSSEHSFACYSYKSNKLDNNQLNIPIVFVNTESFSTLGFINNNRIF